MLHIREYFFFPIYEYCLKYLNFIEIGYFKDAGSCMSLFVATKNNYK